MISYESLDTIADSYTPFLFVGCLIRCISLVRSNDRFAWLKGLAGVSLCYLVMAVDNYFLLWKSIGLDYSTHSSVAFALSYFLVHNQWSQGVIRFVIPASLLAYYWLEMVQQYHSLADIVSTIFVVWPMILGAYFLVEALRGFRFGTRSCLGSAISESGNR